MFNRWPAWALLLNALIWGLSWWPFQAMQALGLHPVWATGVLYALALLCLLLLRPGAVRACRGHPELMGLALAAGLTNLCFNWAVTTGDVLRVVLLFYLMPAWVVLLAWLLLGERPKPRALLRLLLALAGVVVVLKSPSTPWPWPQHSADWLALAGGLCFALTNVLLRRLHNTPDTARMLSMLAGGSAVGLLAAALAGLLGAGAAMALPANWDWLPWAAGTGLAFLLANIGLQYGAARLPANTTAVLMLTEVVFAAVSSVWLGAASLSPRTVLGAALLLGAALWASLERPD